MFRPFRPFYYFSRLEISFALLFGDDCFASEVSFERKSFFSSQLSTEAVNMDQKRLHVETGSFGDTIAYSCRSSLSLFQFSFHI